MISGIILIATCALFYRNYAELAFEYNKSRVGFGILGLGIFLVSYLLFGLIAGIIIGLSGMIIANDFMMLLLTELLMMGAGALATWIVRSALKKSWVKQRANGEMELLDK